MGWEEKTFCCESVPFGRTIAPLYEQHLTTTQKRIKMAGYVLASLRVFMKKELSISLLTLVFASCANPGATPKQAGLEPATKITDENALHLLRLVPFTYLDAFDYGYPMYAFDPAEWSTQANNKIIVEFPCEPYYQNAITVISGNWTHQRKIPENGNAQVQTTFTPCSNNEFNWLGEFSSEWNWTGWINGEAKNASVSFSFNNLEFGSTQFGIKYFGELDYSGGNNEEAISYEILLEIDELGKELKRIRAITPSAIIHNLGFGSSIVSGQIRIEGVEGSYLLATVIPTGFSITVNGGRSFEITWDELGV